MRASRSATVDSDRVMISSWSGNVGSKRDVRDCDTRVDERSSSWTAEENVGVG
jgi:hypothetical protein